MKTTRILWMTCAAFFVLFGIPHATAQVEIPAAINYQGKLTDQNGTALSSGYYVVEFRIWKDPTMTSVSELAWGRSFPIHVVSGGIFNVLLTDDGAPLSDGGSGPILSAFGGPDRYLGLTVVQQPHGTVQNPSEIKPRQQLVSAPYTIQAQNANHVAADGVSTSSLANGSVTTAKIVAGNVTSGTIASSAITTDKIANSAVTEAKLASAAVTTAKIADSQVTTAKIGNNQVTTAKIGDGQVTAAKLELDANINLQGHDLYFSADENTGLKYDTSFGGTTSLDGAVLFGNASGVLGTKSGGNKAALSWNSTSGVSLFGPTVDISSKMTTGVNDFTTYGFTAKREGFLMFFIYGSWFEVRLFAGAANEAFFNLDGQAPLGEMMTWPMHIGDKVTIKLVHNHNNDNPNKLWFLPLGVGQGASADDVMTFSHN